MNHPALTDFIEPHWDRAALLTIDMQNDFTLPTGAGYVPGTDRILPQLARLLTAFRSHSRPVLHAVRLYFEDGSNAEYCRRSLLQSGVSLARPGTTGARPVEIIQPASAPDGHEALLKGDWLQLAGKRSA